MKIGITTDIVDSTKYHKGVSYYIQYLVKKLAVMSDDDIYLIHFRHANNDIYKLGLNEIILGNSNSDFSKFLTSFRKRDLLKELDVIHTTAPRVPYFPFYSISNVKKVLTVHAMDLYIPPLLRAKFYKQPKAWFQQKVFNLYFSRVKDKIDAYITVSHFLKEELIKNMGIPEEKILPIHLAVDEKFKPANFEKPFDFILSDTPEPELIEIFYKLKRKRIKHKLVIFSMRGYGYNMAKEMVDELDLQNECYFKGYVPENELVKLYNTADVYVRLAGYEGFGLPPLEAMACGCPVITTNVGSLPEVVGDAGILLDFIDVDGFVNAIYEVLTDEGLREKMRKKGLKRAKMFSWEKTARETMKVYRKLVNEV